MKNAIHFENLLGHMVNVWVDGKLTAYINSHYGEVESFEWAERRLTERTSPELSETEIVELFKTEHTKAWKAEHTLMDDGYAQWVNMENIEDARAELDKQLGALGFKLEIKPVKTSGSTWFKIVKA
jgi:hypothetical protein